ncbi:MAG: hypothetical protein RLY86_1532 [Pseudomonadota bacterium]|jgi:RimJ/RimL family protein N-acetyltransferase
MVTEAPLSTPATAVPTATPTAAPTAEAASGWPPPPFRELRTRRLVLRALSMSDAAAMHAVLSDPDSMRFWYHLPHGDMAETEALLRDRRLPDHGYHRVWAITTDGGEWLGDVTVYHNGGTPGLLWLGYLLKPSARGKGYAVEAAAAALDYGFEEWGAHRIEANLDPENAGSIAVLDRLGFHHEGIQRRNFLLGTDWKDTGIHGLLVEEWRAHRATVQRRLFERGA